MNRFEIIGSEADHERARRLLQSGGFDQEWHFSYRAGEREEGLEIWARKALRTIIPWVEKNKGDAAAIDDVALGLLEWCKVTDQAIVTTSPGHLDIYDVLRNRVHHRVHGMRIIPGLKTNDLLRYRFGDFHGWTGIGKELAGMAERTGSKIVVLEHESAIERYRLGREVIDWTIFRKCLAQLPKDLTIWWYPAMTGENDDEQDRMTSLSCEIVESCGNVVLLDHQSRGGPRALTYSWSIKGREKLDEIVRDVPGASILPMLYFLGPKEPYWQDDQIHEALDAAGSDKVIIYPGAKGWERMAKLFVKALGTSSEAEVETISGE